MAANHGGVLHVPRVRIDKETKGTLEFGPGQVGLADGMGDECCTRIECGVERRESHAHAGDALHPLHAGLPGTDWRLDDGESKIANIHLGTWTRTLSRTATAFNRDEDGESMGLWCCHRRDATYMALDTLLTQT